MQYLKDEMRSRITEKALIEFREKGYTGASIRSIAKNSGTSTGNIYKYFHGKDDLYETLVGSVYSKLTDCIRQFSEVELNENAETVFYELMGTILGIIEESSHELSILLNKSAGSKYENCKSTFINLITDIVTGTIRYELAAKGKILKDGFIIYLLSNSMVESISIILLEKENSAEARALILDLIEIFFGDLAEKLAYQKEVSPVE
ncbi:MAG: Transcriptional regulator (TetR/AcrR family) [Firmicutes bacterium]|nr:Transcriptional regulator (TetR/AcrR family) [Bacillota bacterium]